MRKTAAIALILVSFLSVLLSIFNYVYFNVLFNSFDYSIYRAINYANSFLFILIIASFSIIIFSYTKYNIYVLIPGILFTLLSIIRPILMSIHTPGLSILYTFILPSLAVMFLIIAFILIKPFIKTSYIPLMLGLGVSLFNYILNYFVFRPHNYFYNPLINFLLILPFLIYNILLIIFLLNYISEADSIISIESSDDNVERAPLDSIGRIGAILNIISGSFGVFGFIIFLIVIIISYRYSVPHGFILMIFILILSSLILGVLSIIYNTDVYKGKLECKTKAIIFGFLTGSIIGSILLVLSNPEENSSIKMHPYQNQSHDIDVLYKYKQMLDDDIITEEEFIELKKNHLNNL